MVDKDLIEQREKHPAGEVRLKYSKSKPPDETYECVSSLKVDLESHKSHKVSKICLTLKEIIKEMQICEILTFKPLDLKTLNFLKVK